MGHHAQGAQEELRATTQGRPQCTKRGESHIPLLSSDIPLFLPLSPSQAFETSSSIRFFIQGERIPLRPYMGLVAPDGLGLTKWHGQEGFFIDRFDARVELDRDFESRFGDREPRRAPHDESDEARAQFESFKDLLLPAAQGLTEEHNLSEAAKRIKDYIDGFDRSDDSESDDEVVTLDLDQDRTKEKRTEHRGDVTSQYSTLRSVVKEQLSRIAERYGINNIGKQVKLDLADEEASQKAKELLRRELLGDKSIENKSSARSFAHLGSSYVPAYAKRPAEQESKPLVIKEAPAAKPSGAAPKKLTPMELLRLKTQKMISNQFQKEQQRDAAKAVERERENRVRMSSCGLWVQLLPETGRGERKTFRCHPQRQVWTCLL